MNKKLDRFKNANGMLDISPEWALVIVILELIETLKEMINVE